MAQTLHILIVEDSEDDVELILRQLRNNDFNPTFERVETPAEMIAALQRGSWDMVISDHNMPKFDSFEALTILQDKGDDIPFVVVSGKIGEETAVSVMQAGAHDYVMKENLAKLPQVVRRQLSDAVTRRERRRADEALVKTVAELKRAQKLAQIGSWEWDLSTGEVFCSEEMQTIFGIEAVSRTTPLSLERIFESIHPDDLEEAREIEQLTSSSGEPVATEYRVVWRDGTIRFIRSEAEAYTNGDDKPAKIIGIVQDITEQWEAEQLARIQRELGFALGAASDLDEVLRLCIDAAIRIPGIDAGGIYLLDEKSGDLNLRIHQGFSPEFLPQITFYKANSSKVKQITSGNTVHLSMKQARIPLDSPQAKEGLRVALFIPVRHYDEVIASLYIASRTLDEVPPLVRTSLENISTHIGGAIASRKTMQRLAESEDKFRLLSEQSLVAILILQDNLIKYANQEAAEISEYTVDELLAFKPNDFTRLIHPKDQDFVIDQVRKKQAGKKDVATHHSFRLITQAGYEKWVEVYARTIMYDGRTADLMTLLDVSDRKKIEFEREALIKDLKTALEKIKTLSGMIPICAHCKKIRDDQGYWNQVETYISMHSEAEFSHSICPECMKELYPQYYEKATEAAKKRKPEE